MTRRAPECPEDFTRSPATHVPFGEIAAVVMEPVLGDGGLHPPPVKYVRAMRRLCRDNGILFCVDEVQQGLCWAGVRTCIDNFGVEPDVVTFGKSLSGRFPLSAADGRTAASLKALRVIEDVRLLERSMPLGEIARARFAGMQ